MNRYAFIRIGTKTEAKPLFVKPHVKKNKKIKPIKVKIAKERVCSICGFHIDDDQHVSYSCGHG